MSGDLDIRHGGAIAVDPAALRAVAEALVALAPGFTDAAAAMRSAHAHLASLPTASVRVDMAALWGSIDRAEALHQECLTAGENTRLMADVYELVERKTELAALSIQGSAGADALLDRIEELEASDPRVVEMEKWLLAGWEKGRFEGLDEQLAMIPSGSPLGASARIILAAAAAIGARGAGRIPPGATLTGSGGPVSVTPVKTSAPIAPPTGVAEALRRFPNAPDAQLKVEKYTMANGTNKFVLYSRGTQGVGSKEPFDAANSNWELYVTKQEPASYAATVEALEAAGARPGDEVHVYAHSQGAMNAAYLSSQSKFDVAVQVTAGSPVHLTAREEQLLIELRHTDDLVSGLAGGGMPGGSGSPDSLVATRDSGTADLLYPPHRMESYTETAEMLDASRDVRLEAWRDKARELNQAVSIESTEYVAKRE